LLRIVCRPQDSGIAAEVGHDLVLVPDVIARSEHIDSPIEEFIGNLRSHAETGGGVLAIQYRQIRCELIPKLFEVMVHDGSARLSDGVADEENFHEEEKPHSRRVISLI